MQLRPCCFAGCSTGAPIKAEGGVQRLSGGVANEELWMKRGAGRKGQRRVRVSESEHRRAERPCGSLGVVSLRELRFWVVVEHLQDRGKLHHLVENEMLRIEGTGVRGSRYFDAAVDTGQTAGLDELADGIALRFLWSEEQFLPGFL